MVLLPENRKILREKGVTFYLEAPVEVLVRRLSEDPMSDTRPSLTGKGLLEEVAGVVKSREPLYREASHHCVSTDQPVKNIVREISQKLHKDIS
jgi:shikimate kinase